MSILRIRDASGNFVAIPSIRGDKGEKGDKGDAGGVTAINGISPDGSGNVTLGAADVGALAADGTAADSSKLGGKAPEYYLQPPNLLSNSDFRNPVNQAGLGGVHGAFLYAIDLWLYNGVASELSLNDGNGMTFAANKVIYQNTTENLTDGKIRTLGIGAADGKIGCLQLTGNYSTVGDTGYSATHNYENTVYIKNVGATSPIIWAALYEGSYTADTLPPYVPKGYGAELLECQRYYRELVVLWGTEMGAPTRQKINYSPRMRIEHPTATFAIDTGASASDAAMTINDVDWERLDFTGTSYGQATITLNAEL